MIDPQRTLVLRCPVCRATGEAPEPWLIVHRSYRWMETACRACFGEGYVTKARFHVLKHGKIAYEAVSRVEYMPERTGA